MVYIRTAYNATTQRAGAPALSSRTSVCSDGFYPYRQQLSGEHNCCRPTTMFTMLPMARTVCLERRRRCSGQHLSRKTCSKDTRVVGCRSSCEYAPGPPCVRALSTPQQRPLCDQWTLRRLQPWTNICLREGRRKEGGKRRLSPVCALKDAYHGGVRSSTERELTTKLSNNVPRASL